MTSVRAARRAVLATAARAGPNRPTTRVRAAGRRGATALSLAVDRR